MPKSYRSSVERRFESEEERETRREAVIRKAEEEAYTGFDKLVEQKKENLDRLYKVVQEHPDWTRSELAKHLRISIRTVYRYGQELRKMYGAGGMKTSLSEQIQQKKKRIAKLVKLLKTHPEYSRRRLCEELKVSQKTLYSYLGEIEG